MRRFSLLFRREVFAYFVSPITWGLFALAWVLFGLIFAKQILPRSGEIGGDLLYMNWSAANQAIFLQLFLVPLLTMRLLSEEKRTGTFEMLVTAPVKDHEIVLAKYFAAFLINSLMWAILPCYSLVMKLAGGNPDFGPVFSAYLSVISVGGVFTAIGVLSSALTRHQIMAGFLAIVLNLGFIFLPSLSEKLQSDYPTVASVLAAGNLMKQVEEGARGLVDLVHFTFQICASALLILFAVRILEIRKWA